MEGKEVLDSAPLPPVPPAGAEIPPLPDDLTFLPGVPEDFTPLYNLPETMEYKRMKWLESEKKWENRVGDGWIPKRVLGMGGFGIVGHWAYEGIDKDLKSVTNVAVKQQLRTQYQTLDKEAKYYMRFRDSNTKHIPKMYQTVYTEQGKGTSLDRYDTFGLVDRMFMEFCEGGDLTKLVSARIRKNAETNGAFTAPLSSLELWELFHCLALALLVMDSGSEKYDGSVDKRNLPETVHLDLKPENVFLGAATRDEEHFNKPPAKIGDFGLSIDVQRGFPQNTEFLKRYKKTGTSLYLAPEQLCEKTREAKYSRGWQLVGVMNPRLGTKTNIWQVGLIMHCLLHTRNSPNFEDPGRPDFLRCVRPPMGTLGLTRGGFTICTTDDLAIYNTRNRMPNIERHSRVLYLILECLLISPASRPDVVDLAKRTREGLDNERAYRRELRKEENKQKARDEREARKARGEETDGVTTDDDLDEFSPGPPHDEPLLSAAWYAGQANPPVKPIRPASPKTAMQLARLRKEQYRKLREQQDPQIKEYAKGEERQAQRPAARVVPNNLRRPNAPLPGFPGYYNPNPAIANPNPPSPPNIMPQRQPPQPPQPPRILIPPFVDIMFVFQANRGMFQLRAPVPIRRAVTGIPTDWYVNNLIGHLGTLGSGISRLDMQLYTGARHWPYTARVGDIYAFMTQYRIQVVYVYGKRL